MASQKRSAVVAEGQVGTYHCTARCVRQAFLCGRDSFTGQSFSHRRQWIEDLLKEFAKLTCVDIQFHAVLSNHFHVILRARPDLGKRLPDAEVARRYKKINLIVKSKNSKMSREPTDEEIEEIIAAPERIADIRQKLSHPSTLMAALCEHIARRANHEDNKKGRFWEGRYKCQRLDSLGALLLCAIYVELNPIRACMARTPKSSPHTSLYHRLGARRLPSMEVGQQSPEKASARKSYVDDSWLSPFTLQDSEGHIIGKDKGSTNPNRQSDRGILPISLDKFAALVDIAGRVARNDKPGYIPNDLPGIMERLGLREENWVNSALQFDQIFGGIVTDGTAMRNVAKDRGKKWIGGINACRSTFR